MNSMEQDPLMPLHLCVTRDDLGLSSLEVPPTQSFRSVIDAATLKSVELHQSYRVQQTKGRVSTAESKPVKPHRAPFLPNKD